MGCKCKSGRSKVINNLKNQEVLEMVQDTLTNEVGDRTIDEIDNLSWTSIYGVWNLVFPNSSGTPNKEQVIIDLKSSLQFLKKTHQRR